MNARLINLDEWIPSGGGIFSEIYFHRSNPARMIKFMAGNTTEDDLLREVSNSQYAYRIGLPTPAPGELVTDGKRLGLMFERIVGKVSYARAIGEHPEEIGSLAEEFAGIVRILHSTPCDTSAVPSVKQIYEASIRRNVFRSKEVIKRALDFLYSLPDVATCLHGDLHFGNMIKAEGKTYLIDLVNLCYGPPLIDFGMIPNLLTFSKVAPEKFIEDYHCTPEQAAGFWLAFLKAYFGEDIDLALKQKEIQPYVAVRAIASEGEAGFYVPSSDVDEIFGS